MNKLEWMKATIAAAAEMPKYGQELCALDTQIGDGDHGVTVARGYQTVAAGITVDSEMDLADFCKQFGQILSTAMGGAIGPVYNCFWAGFARALAEKDEVDTAALNDGLQAAVNRIGRVCKVIQGEKTMFDALKPTADEVAANLDKTLEEAMELACAAAEKGSNATADMLAKKGRAKFLMERSIGHIDAGSKSFVMWMNEWTAAVKKGE